MGNITLWLQVSLWLVKLVYQLVSIASKPKDIKKISERAVQQVKVLKLANDPDTTVTPEEVHQTFDDHMDEINEIIDSADFQRIKRGE